MITARGYIGFERRVKNFEAEFLNKIRGIVARTAEMLVSQAKALAPVDIGNLKRSIDVIYEQDGLRAIVTVGADYGIYVEYGTGIYATQGGGRMTPWVYYVPGGYVDDNGERQFYVKTRGNRAQPFWTPSFEIAAEYFESEMNRLG